MGKTRRMTRNGPCGPCPMEPLTAKLAYNDSSCAELTPLVAETLPLALFDDAAAAASAAGGGGGRVHQPQTVPCVSGPSSGVYDGDSTSDRKRMTLPTVMDSGPPLA